MGFYESLCMDYERCSTDFVVLYVGGEVTCHRDTIVPRVEGIKVSVSVDVLIVSHSLPHKCNFRSRWKKPTSA